MDAASQSLTKHCKFLCFTFWVYLLTHYFFLWILFLSPFGDPRSRLLHLMLNMVFNDDPVSMIIASVVTGNKYLLISFLFIYIYIDLVMLSMLFRCNVCWVLTSNYDWWCINKNVYWYYLDRDAIMFYFLFGSTNSSTSLLLVSLKFRKLVHVDF